MEKISFENLPQAVSQLISKIDSLEQLLITLQNAQVTSSNKPLSIDDASKFVNLSVPTIYSLVSKRMIPFSKLGKRLYFSEEDLSNWIKSGRKQTIAEDNKTYPSINLIKH